MNYDSKLGSEFVDHMLTCGKLNNGKPTLFRRSQIGEYVFGLILGHYKGLKTVSHGERILGIRTEMIRFLEQRFTVIWYFL